MKNVSKLLILTGLMILNSCSKDQDLETTETWQKSEVFDQESFSGLEFESDRVQSVSASQIDPSVEAIQFENIEAAQEFIYKTLGKGKSFSGNAKTGLGKENSKLIELNIPKKMFQSARDPGENDGVQACGYGQAVVSTSTWGGDFSVNIAWSNTGDFKFESEYIGFVFGGSYRQSGDGLYLEIDGTVNFNIDGYITFFIGHKSIGNFHRRHVTIRGSYNTCNGDYVINYY